MALKCPECKKTCCTGARGLYNHLAYEHRIDHFCAYNLVSFALEVREDKHLYNAFKYVQDRYMKGNYLKKGFIMNTECFRKFFTDYKYNLNYLLFFNESTGNYEIVSRAGHVICIVPPVAILSKKEHLELAKTIFARFKKDEMFDITSNADFIYRLIYDNEKNYNFKSFYSTAVKSDPPNFDNPIRYNPIKGS